MCTMPNVPEPVQRQAAQTPAYRESSDTMSRKGRRGTILTGSQGVMDQSAATPRGKTLLGQ